MSKEINKEVTRKRYNGYGNEKQLKECVAILDLARADFLAVLAKLQGPKKVPADQLDKNDCLLVLYYLEAVVILKHLQRPGVVTNMTVEEWQERRHTNNGCSVAIKEHKTAASQVAEVPLNAEQEHWFDIYFKHIRPLMLQGSRTGGDTMAEGQFFISSTGRPIHNPCNDLVRLHGKYKVKPVTSGDARMAFETAAKNLPETDRNALARLLRHTPETAERHYRMRTPADALLAQRVVEDLVAKSSAGSTSYTSREQKVDERTAFEMLIRSFPVTLEGQPPKKPKRQELCGEHERHCYDRWRSEQLKLRESCALEHFGRRHPSVSAIEAWIQSQGWSSNLPQAALILSQWEEGQT
ncbi:uncharacterized protein [Paramisgurnus dabryanus]|uniref:uncharacterized protein n=1 Tax=Paramisgurnus dabryanus TaxID=90735 RepID=UPI0031F34CA9